MEPRFEATSGHLIIEWMEHKKGESPKHHYYNKKPLKLQFHPKEKDKLVRAYFSGALPGWMKRYAALHKYEVQQVNHQGKSGWWIARWAGFDETPFSAVTIKGAVRQLSKQIPFVCKDLREKIEDNMAAIERNLSFEPTAFESCGLYFSKEMVEQKQGCLLLEAGVIPERKTDESDEDYFNRIEATGKLAELIWEITTPLPGSEIDIDDEESELDLVETDETIEDEVLVDLNIELESEGEPITFIPIEEESEEILNINIDEDFYEEPIVVLEEIVDSTPTIEISESFEKVDIEDDKERETEYEPVLIGEDESKEVSVTDEDLQVQSEDIEQQESETIFSEPVVLDRDEKKSKALAGQMMLF